MATSKTPRLPGVPLPGGGGSSPDPVTTGGAVSTPGRANPPQVNASGGDRCAPAGGRTWTIAFPIAMELLTSNDSQNWARTHRIGTVIKSAAIVLCRAQKIPRIERASITVEFLPPTGRRRVVREAHNLAPSAKYAIDGCVKAGVLTDDADKYVAAVTYISGERTPGGQLLLYIHELETPR